MDASAAAPMAQPPPRGRRDEWSEGAVRRLLEAYETAWSLRGRAKLRGSDWAGIERHVSIGSRAPSPETTTTREKSARQCKNKVESIKKRFRSETSTRPGSSPARRSGSSSSTWRFYGAMERLLAGAKSEIHQAILVPDTWRVVIGPSANNNNNKEEVVGEERGGNANLSSSKNQLFQYFPECRTCDYGDEEEDGEEGTTKPNTTSIDPSNKRKSPSNEVPESIRVLAHSILNIEKARIKMCKNSEKVKAEAEVRRGETELKMTEIVAETQLRIAKLLAKRLKERGDKSGSSNQMTNEASSSSYRDGHGWRQLLESTPSRGCCLLVVPGHLRGLGGLRRSRPRPTPCTIGPPHAGFENVSLDDEHRRSSDARSCLIHKDPARQHQPPSSCAGVRSLPSISYGSSSRSWTGHGTWSWQTSSSTERA